MSADADLWLPISGLVIGMLLGGVARRARFCTLGAFERHWYADDDHGLRDWALAAAVAILGSWALALGGYFDPESSFYLRADISLTGVALGGAMFGLGMALVGTCAFGALVRFGAGSLAALVVVLTVGFAALVTQRGLLLGAREWLYRGTAIDLSPATGQSLGQLATRVVGVDLTAVVPPIVAAVLIALVMRDSAYRARYRQHVAAALVGSCIVAGWFACSLLADHLMRSVQIESASFVLPPGEIVLASISPTWRVPDYGMGLVFGVVIGAAASAIAAGELRWEACDDARELGRHIVGGWLMGIGGVLAGGCTFGQGLSALSLLAVSAPVALISIALGARVGLTLLIEGRLPFMRAA